MMQSFFRKEIKPWRKRQQASELEAEKEEKEAERRQTEGPIEDLLRRYGYLASNAQLSAKAMQTFVKAHKEKLTAPHRADLQAAWKAANKSSKAGLLAYLHKLIITDKKRVAGGWSA